MPFVLSALLAAVALTVLGYRLLHPPAAPRPPKLLRIKDTVEIPPPPPIPSDDRIATAERLASLESFRSAARADPKDVGVLLTLGERAEAAGDHLTACQTLRAAAGIISRPDPELYDRLGRSERALGLYAASQRTYQRLIALAPERVTGYIGACYALTAMHRPADGMRALERASRALQAHDVHGRVALAREFDQRLAPARALEELEIACAADPNDPDARLALAQEQLKNRRSAAAQRSVEAWLAADPNAPAAHRLLAEILVDPLASHPDPALAEHHFVASLRGDPQDVQVWQELARLYLNQRRFRQAAYAYTRLLYLQPGVASARFPLARAYAALGDTKTAAEQRALAEQLLARDRTEDHLRVQRMLRPTDVSLRLTMARHYIETGQFARALADLQAAYCLSPDSRDVRHALGTLYAELGVAIPAPVKEARR